MQHVKQPTGALAGVRVIDLSRVLGGPSCTQILADHGADVIKIEPPAGDETREWGPPFETDENGDPTASSYFIGVNRNKRCIALDLRKPEGKAVLLRLLETADVLVENFKAGSMEKWGLGYEAVLKDKFPQLIHCQITGFGADGPLGGYPGYDAAVQAMTGLFSINGSPASGPTRIGIPIIDLGTGMNAVIGICMALLERHKSGLGQAIDITLYDTGVALQFPHGSNWFMSGNRPKRVGNAHTNVAPYDLFPTKTQAIFIAIGNNGQFRKAMTILGRSDLADDPRFTSNGGRIENISALTAEITALLVEWDGAELTERFLEAGVPAGLANSVDEVVAHPHTLHREMVVRDGGYTGLAAPVKLGRTPATYRSKPQAFGANTQDVLHDAGYSDAEITALVAGGAVLTKRSS
ncbi:MAG: CoA transferase [Rhodospirillales bacterium]|nr:CoA transferase [Rhodospirillales bacterium]